MFFDPEVDNSLFPNAQTAIQEITRQLIFTLKKLNLNNSNISNTVWLAFNSALQIFPPVLNQTVILGLEQIYGLVFTQFPEAKTQEAEILILESIVIQELQRAGIEMEF